MECLMKQLCFALVLSLNLPQTFAEEHEYQESVNPPPQQKFLPLPLQLLGSESIGYSMEEGSSVVAPTPRPTTYTAEERGKIIGDHNNYRRNVLPSAANMNALKWDSDLASMAQGWSDYCFFEHGNPPNTAPFDYVGQNLFIRWTTKKNPPPPDPSVPTRKWYDEVMSYNYQDRSCSSVCGHYTQVVWAKTTHVGCGQTLCEKATDNNGKIYDNAWLITCNYGPGGNLRGQHPYLEGEKCSKCVSPSTCRGGLCKECDLVNDDACMCGIQCENCGYTNTTSGDCACECERGFWGNFCQNPCIDTHKYCGANPGWPNKSYCKFHPLIPQHCPLMCEICEKGDPDFQCGPEQMDMN
ncbi:GLIPR1-like protein 1 [Holothuria leucospilota]|uniref:GLIPR1-like protein 1 n=1 Tax=Holothuria leucospilota TaxID=206669 RepID=A0A9Q1CCF4_HOLLE|nr:GLIPR1-like protein 1 [Holothuria leucospilota]